MSEEKAREPKWWRLFAAENQGDAQRFVIVHQALVDLLVQDPRLVSAYSAWADRTGVTAAMFAFLDTADVLALSLGLESRGSLFSGSKLPSSAEMTPALNAEIAADVATLRKLYEEVADDMGRHLDELMIELSKVLSEIGLEDWRVWLAVALVERATEDVSDHLVGHERERTPVVERDFAPAVSRTFCTHEWETVQDARERLKNEFSAWMKEWELPTGRAPHRDAEYLHRNVRWFYEHCVKQPRTSQRELARVHRQALGSNVEFDTKNVRDGIADVKRLLGLAAVPIAPDQGE